MSVRDVLPLCFRKRRFKTHKCACLFLTAFILTVSASWTSECFINGSVRTFDLFIFIEVLSCFPRPLCERRKFLHDNMVEVPNRILFSEMKHVTVRFPFPNYVRTSSIWTCWIEYGGGKGFPFALQINVNSDVNVPV